MAGYRYSTGLFLFIFLIIILMRNGSKGSRIRFRNWIQGTINVFNTGDMKRKFADSAPAARHIEMFVRMNQNQLRNTPGFVRTGEENSPIGSTG
ncbi:unnamed protein product [Caenorhabditis nigoni]